MTDDKYMYFAFGFFMGNMAVALCIAIINFAVLVYLGVLFASVVILAVIESSEKGRREK